MPDSNLCDPDCTAAQGNGFTRALRLVEARDYSKVFKAADARFPLPGLLVLLKKNGRAHPRLGLAIAKKHLARATARNRVKRLIRESFRRHQRGLVGWDVVVVSRAGLRDIPGKTINDKLQKTWQQIKPCFGP